VAKKIVGTGHWRGRYAIFRHSNLRNYAVPRTRYAVTLVTCDAQPLLTRSDRALKEELENSGASVRVAIWTDSEVDWSASNLTVIRSTWDGCTRFREFEGWLRRIEAETRVCNPVEKILWNFEKHYLVDLHRRGIEIIPTVYFQAKSHVSLNPTDINWPDVVAKPSIGGSSIAVRRFSIPAELSLLENHLNGILTRTGALMQRFEETVTTLAERSLVFIGGEYSHAVRRIPFNTADTPDSPQFDHEAEEAEIAFATQVLEVSDSKKLSFARVDVLPGPTGLLLMELELIEPALFLTRRTGAARKLASTLLALL
jgi:hypothetical protein